MSKAHKRATELPEASRTAKENSSPVSLLTIKLVGFGIAGHLVTHLAGWNHQRPVEVFHSVGCTGDANRGEAIIQGLGNSITPPRVGVGQGELL